MRKYRYILILIVILLNILQPVYATNDSIIQQDLRNNLIDKIFDFLNIVIIAANFLFVVWIYFKDKQEKKEYDKNSYKMYWYKKFILENYLDLIECFFNECEENIKNIKEEKSSCMTLDELQSYKMNKFMSFNKNQSIIKQKLTSILSILDENISENIRNVFIKLQEEFTEFLEKIIMSDDTNYIQRLQDCMNVLSTRKKEILSELYKYGEKIIK